MASARKVLTLYRNVLRAAARFPSKKRASIIEDIKLEFREARHSGIREQLSSAQLAAVFSASKRVCFFVHVACAHLLQPQGAAILDSVEVQRRVALAEDGLVRLRQYSGALPLPLRSLERAGLTAATARRHGQNLVILGPVARWRKHQQLVSVPALVLRRSCILHRPK
jgi:hypothetical protein